MRQRTAIAVAVIAITALGYLSFPAHTWLQQDTQIYVPILEHLYDNSVLANDPVAIRHHMGFTVYDEVALALRRATGAGFKAVLAADQIVFRAAGILGVYLMALALGLSRRSSLVVAAVYALGASVMGPAVLTVEYEPKPRGSAIGMILLAMGLAGRGRYLAAGIAASAAFLYHPPTTYPFWVVWLVFVAFAAREERRERLGAFLPLVVAAVALFALSRLQAGGPEPEAWFTRLTPELERLQRLRAPYNWVSGWVADWAAHYLLLWVVTVVALWRLRERVPTALRFLLGGLPLVGILSVLFSYLTYDVGKWALMAKFQPARALLWVSAVAAILAASACLQAAQRQRLIEPVVWGVVAFAIPVQHNIWDLLAPDLSDPLIVRRVVMVIALGVLASLSGWLSEQRRRWSWSAWAVAIALPFFAIPHFGKVITERNMHEPELDELSGWAREHTPSGAVFLFPDVGKGRQPGIFRAKALRTIYVDWKSGGQANMVLDFAEDWWKRYDATVAHPFQPADMERYPSMGIDYIVLQDQNRLRDREPVHENERYLVYGLP